MFGPIVRLVPLRNDVLTTGSGTVHVHRRSLRRCFDVIEFLCESYDTHNIPRTPTGDRSSSRAAGNEDGQTAGGCSSPDLNRGLDRERVVSLAPTPLEHWPRLRGHRPEGRAGFEPAWFRYKRDEGSLTVASVARRKLGERVNTGLFHRPESLRHDSNVRLLLYREASSPLDHGETCRREDSNLGRTYVSGPEPLPVDRLGTATSRNAAETRSSAASRIRTDDRV
jgi:hypothetical protein